MLVEIPDVLSVTELANVRRLIEAADFVDGRVTAGELAAQAKHNLQLPQEGYSASFFTGLPASSSRHRRSP